MTEVDYWMSLKTFDYIRWTWLLMLKSTARSNASECGGLLTPTSMRRFHRARTDPEVCYLFPVLCQPLLGQVAGLLLENMSPCTLWCMHACIKVQYVFFPISYRAMSYLSVEEDDQEVSDDLDLDVEEKLSLCRIMRIKKEIKVIILSCRSTSLRSRASWKQWKLWRSIERMIVVGVNKMPLLGRVCD